MMVLDFMAVSIPYYQVKWLLRNAMTMIRPGPPNIVMSAPMSNVGVKVMVFKQFVPITTLGHHLARLGARSAQASGKHPKAGYDIMVAMLERKPCAITTDLAPTPNMINV